MEDLDSVFPTMELRFKDGAVLPMKPLQYLFVLGPGAYCLGMFDNGNSGTLIGGITVRNVLVQVSSTSVYSTILLQYRVATIQVGYRLF
jgi:hypothetical protein